MVSFGPLGGAHLLAQRYILDEAGEPAPVSYDVEWNRWMDDEAFNEQRQVSVDHLTFARITTAFVGVDASVVGTRQQPRLWETKIDGGPLDGETKRYASAAEAVSGHVDMVMKAMEAEL